MQKDKRQNSILEKLKIAHKISTQQLAEELAVSEDTIRRDLNEMAQKGLLSKVHRGAVSSIQKLYYHNDQLVRLFILLFFFGCHMLLAQQVHIRTNMLGYLPEDTKVAFIMSDLPIKKKVVLYDSKTGVQVF